MVIIGKNKIVFILNFVLKWCACSPGAIIAVSPVWERVHPPSTSDAHAKKRARLEAPPTLDLMDGETFHNFEVSDWTHEIEKKKRIKGKEQ